MKKRAEDLLAQLDKNSPPREAAKTGPETG